MFYVVAEVRELILMNFLIFYQKIAKILFYLVRTRIKLRKTFQKKNYLKLKI